MLYRQSGPDAEGLASIDAGKCVSSVMGLLHVNVYYMGLYIYIYIYMRIVQLNS